MSRVAPNRITKAHGRIIPVKLFYTLGPGDRYLRPAVKSYWHHLTLESYHIYEMVYNQCKSPDGKVTCTSLLPPSPRPHSPGN